MIHNFSFTRVFIAYFLPGLLWWSLFAPLLEWVLNTRIVFLNTNAAPYAVYILLFIPTIIFSIGLELMQKYIKKYFFMGLMSGILALTVLFTPVIYFLLFVYNGKDNKLPASHFQSNSVSESLFYLLIFFMICFFVGIIMKYIYNKKTRRGKC